MQPKFHEIWLADLNPRVGTEPGKIRPVLVVQSNLLNAIHPSILICPLTTNVTESSQLLRVHIPSGISGTKIPSDVMIDQIRAIDKRRLVRKLGKLPDYLATHVRENLKIVMELW
jgi:mRNA interferase MazF